MVGRPHNLMYIYYCVYTVFLYITLMMAACGCMVLLQFSYTVPQEVRAKFNVPSPLLYIPLNL